MTSLPTEGYLEDSSRTVAEQKVAFDQIRDVVAEMLGGAASSELTISSGSVTVAAKNGGQHTIDTESDASTDDLNNIVVSPTRS